MHHGPVSLRGFSDGGHDLLKPSFFDFSDEQAFAYSTENPNLALVATTRSSTTRFEYRHNLLGEKIGWGDLNSNNALNLMESLEEGAVFIILPEEQSF